MPWWMIRRICLAPEDLVPGGAAPNGQQPPAAPPAPPPPQTGGEQVTTTSGKVLPMTQVRIEDLKRQQREAGKKAAAKEYEDKLKAAGFSSLDEALKAASERKNGGARTPTQPRDRPQDRQNGTQRTQDRGGNGKPNGQPNPPPQNTQRQDRRDRQREAKLDAERQERIRAERKAAATQQQLHATEAEYELKMLAKDVGIRDPDYAVTLFVRECQGKSEEELAKLDEKKFFEGLRETRPHLFVEPVRPANTGTQQAPNGQAAPPPGAGKVNTAAAQAGQFDARKASNEEYRARLKSMGLKYPGSG